MFNSVPDDVMYKNILNYHEKWKKQENPYFCMVMTTTSHAPFVLSNNDKSKGGVEDYENCIRYVDSSIYEFYEKLKEISFFDNGTLIITADHRAMVPFSKEELDLHGNLAYSRVPLIIIDKDLKKGNYLNRLAHSSLGSIIEYICLDKFTLKEFNIVPFIKEFENTNQTIFYQYSAPRNKVSVLLGNNKIEKFEDKNLECDIYLNGDDTNFNKDCVKINDEDKASILKLINYFRR